MMRRNDTMLFQCGVCRNNAQAIATNTTTVMHSCMTLSCTSVKRDEPMRLAGTWKRYSKKARAQLASIAIQSGACLTFRCPYHASVMKIFDMMRRSAVIISDCSSSNLRPYQRCVVNRRKRLTTGANLGRFKTAPQFVFGAIAFGGNRRACLEERVKLRARVRRDPHNRAVV